jgi:hypothetical protein
MGDLDRDRRRRVIGPREAQRDTIEVEAVAVADQAPVERVRPLAHETLELLLHSFRCVHREALALEPVLVHHVQPVQVDTVVGMAVGDDDRCQLFGMDVLLQVRERTVAAIDPEHRRTGADEITAACPTRRGLRTSRSTRALSVPRPRLHSFDLRT